MIEVQRFTNIRQATVRPIDGDICDLHGAIVMPHGEIYSDRSWREIYLACPGVGVVLPAICQSEFTRLNDGGVGLTAELHDGFDDFACTAFGLELKSDFGALGNIAMQGLS